MAPRSQVPTAPALTPLRAKEPAEEITARTTVRPGRTHDLHRDRCAKQAPLHDNGTVHRNMTGTALKADGTG
jgi:hypothetical protein